MSEPSTIPQQRVAASNGVGRGHYVLLTLIILLGAGLRFAWLDHPTIWGDEGATWARTCGTFQEMLEANRTDGFVPLHYELYWLIGKCWTLTPWRMRLVPAIAGTLMVPAMYFLARQLVRARTALLVALFTATSAYFLNYSRDAKMYMQTWLMLTLHLAFFLSWLRRGGGVAWWAWVLFGVAAVGLHASAWFVVAIGVLMLLTSGRPRWRWLFYPVGIAIMALGPAVYYSGYNTWAERSGVTVAGVESRSAGGSWGMSGIAWIEPQTRIKTGPQLVRESATAYLYGYSRAEEETGPKGIVPIPPLVLHLAWGVLAGIGMVLLAGMVRWPTKQRLLEAQAPWQGWQLLLWLGAWLVVPTYGFFYCRSVSGPESPWQWGKDVAAFIGWQWMWALPAVLLLAWLAGRNRKVLLVAAWVLGLALLSLIALAVWRERAEWYMALLRWGEMTWLVLAAGVLMAGVSWAATAPDVRTRWWRLATGLVAVVVVLALCQGAWWGWDYVRRAADATGRGLHSVWMPRYLAVIAPGVIIVMAIAVMRLPGRAIPALVACAFVAANLTQYGARIVLDPEPRLDLVTADLLGAEKDDGYVVFLRDKYQMGSPGSGTVNDSTARYFLAIGLGGKYSPGMVRMVPTESLLKRPMHRMFSLRWMVTEMKRRPDAHHLIVWEKLSLPGTQTPEAIEKALGPEWRLAGEWSQTTRRHWNWQDMDTCRRLVFVRVKPAPPPATRPGAAPFP